MSDPVISVKNLCRRFGRVQAVDDASFEVQPGSIFGLLGTNGAGKTTLIRVLLGHLYPDSGQVRIFGTDPRRQSAEQLRRTAYVSDRMELPRSACLNDVLTWNRRFFPKWNDALAAELTKEFEIDVTAKFARLSLGQKRRAVILQAVCQGADLLVLDEPFAGLDAIFRRQCLDMLLAATVEHGQTILVSSHLLHDVERIVDTVGMMNAGRLFNTSDLESLKAGMRRLRIEGELPASDDSLKDLTVLDHRTRGEITHLVIDGYRDDIFPRLTNSLGDRLRIEHLNLEDIFVELSTQSKASIATKASNSGPKTKARSNGAAS